MLELFVMDDPHITEPTHFHADFQFLGEVGYYKLAAEMRTA